MYILEANSEVTAMVEKYAADNNCSIIRIRRSRIIDKNGGTVSVIGPEEWLGYIKNADAVFTNSFHGICFSMIFHKKFFCDFRKNSQDTRLSSILKMFDLSDRVLNDSCDFDKEIDYERIDAVIEEKKKYSIGYLKSALEVE